MVLKTQDGDELRVEPERLITELPAGENNEINSSKESVREVLLLLLRLLITRFLR